MSTVIKLADWTLGVDTEPGVSGPVHEIECTTCGESSEASDGRTNPEEWALRHTGSNTSHRSYRGITTSFLRVTPAPGNPYSERADASPEPPE
ncbi:hypothetical protein ACFT9I_32945 [Streptomyces sp. NPDC057137]|uniref:DUF7848 domain-containing protein n=1 Tax=Streptomyces sp. NPDC057137 TaxID=3346030 RepID=UPI003625A670